MKRLRLLALLIGAWSAFPTTGVSAKECLGVGFPDQVQVAGSALQLNGLGLRQATVLKVNVYVAALYVDKTSSDASAILSAPGPKQLVLRFVRDVGASDLAKAWEEGFAANAKAQVPALRARIDTLKGWMGDMKKEQRLTFTHKPGAGIEVDVNGTVKGTVEGDDFARAFLSIWLGAQPPNTGIKTGLLGGACG